MNQKVQLKSTPGKAFKLVAEVEHNTGIPTKKKSPGPESVPTMFGQLLLARTLHQ